MAAVHVARGCAAPAVTAADRGLMLPCVCCCCCWRCGAATTRLMLLFFELCEGTTCAPCSSCCPRALCMLLVHVVHGVLLSVWQQHGFHLARECMRFACDRRLSTRVLPVVAVCIGVHQLHRQRQVARAQPHHVCLSCVVMMWCVWLFRPVARSRQRRHARVCVVPLNSRRACEVVQ